jgi:hypothetical protein
MSNCAAEWFTKFAFEAKEELYLSPTLRRLFLQYDVVLIYRNDRPPDPSKKVYRVDFTSRMMGMMGSDHAMFQ